MKFENLGRKIDGFLGSWKEHWEDRNAQRKFYKAMSDALKNDAKLRWDAKTGEFLQSK